jgi:diacylglycerol O-acyltransferase / wax synthase
MTDRRHMQDSDAFSWYMERDPLLRSTVVTIALLDRAPDPERLRAKVERATRAIPLLRCRVVEPPLRLATPRWATVQDLDLDWHLHRVRLAGGGWDAVLALAARASTTAFDPARPLWEMTVVEGLEDGRAALVMTFHHALTDGIGGVQLAMELFDLQADAGEDPPDPGPVPAEDVAGLRLLWDTVAFDAGRLAGLARAAPPTALRGVVQLVRSPFGAVAEAGRAARSVLRTVAPVRTTLSPVMRERRLGRAFFALDVSLEELREAAGAAGGHVNDAFLAAVTDGLRRYHLQRGVDVERLRVTLPISVRRPEDPPGGNRITLARFALPTSGPDPAARVRAVREQVERWRAEPALHMTQGIAAALNLMPSGVIGGMLKHVDFLASNVPGFPVPVYLAGARVERYYPFGPTIGSSVNVTLMSYAGTCCVGVNCDTGAIEDPAALARCLSEGFDDVLSLSAARRDALSEVP